MMVDGVMIFADVSTISLQRLQHIDLSMIQWSDRAEELLFIMLCFELHRKYHHIEAESCKYKPIREFSLSAQLMPMISI